MGFSTAVRVSSLTMRKTSSSAALGLGRRPARHRLGYGIQEGDLPSASVVMTASPMLESVTSNHSRCWRSSSVLRSSASFAAGARVRRAGAR